MVDRDRREELQGAIEVVIGDATVLPTPQEVATIAGFANELPRKVGTWELTWATSMTCAPGESWLHFAFTPKSPYPTDLKGVEPIDLCLWRFSLAVFPLLEDGSVPDDPISPATFGERFR